MWSAIIFIAGILCLLTEIVIGMFFTDSSKMGYIIEGTFFVFLTALGIAVTIEKRQQKKLDDEEIAKIKAERKIRFDKD